jgi:hypothetical protein
MISHTIDKYWVQTSFLSRLPITNNRAVTAMALRWMLITILLQQPIKKENSVLHPVMMCLSGNDAVAPSGKDNRFDPLYGTPHKFRGSMDYFYAGTGSPLGGLNNAYVKFRYTQVC